MENQKNEEHVEIPSLIKRAKYLEYSEMKINEDMTYDEYIDDFKRSNPNKILKNENYIKTGRTDELEKIIKNLIIDNQDTPNFNLQHILAVVSPEINKPNYDATFCRKSIMWLRDNGFITIEKYVIRPTEKFINEE